MSTTQNDNSGKVYSNEELAGTGDDSLLLLKFLEAEPRRREEALLHIGSKAVSTDPQKAAFCFSEILQNSFPMPSEVAVHAAKFVAGHGETVFRDQIHANANKVLNIVNFPRPSPLRRPGPTWPLHRIRRMSGPSPD